MNYAVFIIKQTRTHTHCDSDTLTRNLELAVVELRNCPGRGGNAILFLAAASKVFQGSPRFHG